MRYFILCLMLFASSAQASKHILSDTTYTFDSDNTVTERYLLGYAEDVNSWRIGAMTGTYRVKDNFGRRSFVETRGVFQTEFNTETSFNGYVSTLVGKQDSHFNAAAYLVHDPESPWRFEWSYERTLLDSTRAIDKDINVDTLSFSADYNITSEWTAVGGYAHQFFTDSNTRSIAFGKLIYSPEKFEGFNVQTSVKYADSKFNPAEYFAPDNQYRILGGFGYAFAFANDQFAFRASFLHGRQTSKWISNSATDAKVEIRGSINDRLYMKLRYIYTNDFTTNDANGFDYWYQMINLDLTYTF